MTTSLGLEEQLFEATFGRAFIRIWETLPKRGRSSFQMAKKPVRLIKQLVKWADSARDGLVLDFFAGSGSTAQAVMEQNNIDGGNRQVILCTNNESNIATEVTYPRLLNVIEGYKQTKNQKEILFELPLNVTNIKSNSAIIESIDKFSSEEYKNRYDEIKQEIRKDKFLISGIIKKENDVKGFKNSLKYYKTEFVGINNILNATDEDKSSLAHKAGFLLALAENTLEEIEQTKFFQLFENDKKVTAVYFKEEFNELEIFVKRVEQINKPISIYLFSWGDKSEFESLFDHLTNVKIKSIPIPILDIYKKIYNIISI